VRRRRPSDHATAAFAIGILFVHRRAALFLAVATLIAASRVVAGSGS
jgi:membrane-associated phospholipid phosphatase